MTSYRNHKLGQESIFTVPERYSALVPIGNGAHGTVCSAFDQITEQKVAIKKLLSPFDSPSSAQRVYRELSLMKHCLHPNIIKIFEVFIPESMQNIYIVMEFMEYSLKEINKFDLTTEQVSYLTYQLACGLKFLQSLGIWHRDLKPANVGVNTDLTVKILDFGLARTDLGSNAAPRLTYYVVTRYYRAPEVILGINYNEKVDIWSLGCILGELMLKYVLFKGDDEMDQWHKITKSLGTPPPEMLARCSTKVRSFIEREARRRPQGSVDIFEDVQRLGTSDEECSPYQAADCLSKMLQIDPHNRIDVNTLLEHPFLSKFRWVAAEVMPDGKLTESAKGFQRSFDKPDWGIRQWKDAIYKLITDTWHSSSPIETDNATSPPRQAPDPLDYSKYTAASTLGLWSPLLGYTSYKLAQRYYPDCSTKQHIMAGTIVFLTSLIISRITK